jgi:hypothetical protein
MKKNIDLYLGRAPQLYQLFSYANPGLALTDLITHGLNQTLRRDGFVGAWAYAYVTATGDYRVKIGSPCDDLTPYERLIPNFLDAGRLALDVYNGKGVQGPAIQFLLPFGLAMANVRSVQLLHYPPTETFSYMDYLYSPTNIRWECLLVQNGIDPAEIPLLERIVDVVPIAADGGNSSGIDPYNDAFIDYGKAQIRNFLQTSAGGFTAPLVAYGNPVSNWLWSAFRDQIAAQLQATGTDNPLRVLSLVTLDIVEGARTPVLCANHPSKYLYYSSVPLADTSKPGEGKYASPVTVMRQDLVAAGWQCAMAKEWNRDAAETLALMNERWAADADVERVIADQDAEFSYPAP